jgi:hypothetical protein
MTWLYDKYFFPKFVFSNFWQKISVIFSNLGLTLNCQVQKFTTKQNGACDPLVVFQCICDILTLIFEVVAFYF